MNRSPQYIPKRLFLSRGGECTGFYSFQIVETTRDDVLDRVMAFANESHGDQMRKFAKEPYVNHLRRVMTICGEYTSDQTVLAAALLHDILEDTSVEKEALAEFLSQTMGSRKASKTFSLVVELTDVFTKKDFPASNRRTRKTWEAKRLGTVSHEAQTIKYADIIDNVKDISRAETDFELVFLRECKEILKHADRGDGRLRRRAIETVDQSLQDYFTRANIHAL